jgi:hypothetical protein
VAEGALQANVRGLGHVGGDFWPVDLGDKRGKLQPMCTAAAAVGPVNNTMALLSPGPDGAIFNERIEMFREGAQITEAIAWLGQQMEAEKVDEATAKRIEALLADRARYYLRTQRGQAFHWHGLESSPWQQRDDELLAICAKVAATLKSN